MRAGDEGRRGDTLGTLVCAELECEDNVRRRTRSANLGFDVGAAHRRRIEMTGENTKNPRNSAGS